MSEAFPISPKIMAIDQAVTLYERMILECVIEDCDLALNGLMYAYERALRERYPYKEIK